MPLRLVPLAGANLAGACHGGGDRQCSEVLHISIALAFSTASRGELSGSVKIKKHISLQKIEDMLYHFICVA